ncbi:amidohydrolase family protein [uncultured Parasphingopyxis sp.]|uniref:amidohydrolase family protein n=1 Tax=uncultured Parasphingopyxis sp. TaxID=1547918 RepID=UPI002619BDD2|nr:amidohydrolase family protein [uncultured Parasphingopyxis sp.]
MRFAILALALAGCSTFPAPEPVTPSQGIIDVHRHAFAQGMPGDSSAETVARLDANDIALSAIHFATRDAYENWSGEYGHRFLKGVSFPCWRDGTGEWFSCQWDDAAYPDLDWLRAEAEAGRLTHLGEIGFVYAGVSPTDPSMLPYWDFAAEFDLPVMVHVNRGPPADGGMRARGCCPDFDPDMGNPELLRPILERHPDLKIVLQHFGFPPLPMFDNIGYVEESFALLRDYPNVMADMSTFHSVPFLSAEQHGVVVRRMQAEGLLDRLVLGSDGWPEGEIIARYEAMDFLSDAERQAIYRDNALRLFGMGTE